MLEKKPASSSEPKPKKKNDLKLMDLIVPALSLGVFMLLIFFVYLPMITQITTMSSDIKKEQARQKQLKIYKDSLATIDQGQMNTDYDNIVKVIPSKMQVADFAYFVDSLAKEKNLQFVQIAAGDVRSQSNPNQPNQSSGTDKTGVSSPVSYQGSYANIIDFLDQLYEYSPYIITISKVSMKKTVSVNVDGTVDDSQDVWVLELSVAGYYIASSNTENNNNINLNTTFLPYTQYKSSIDTLTNKASKL